MRLPNGYGSVYKLSGARRNPYRAVVTTGWKLDGEKAVQERKTIGYYHTKKDALAALAAFNVSPYDLEGKTFSDVYSTWLAEHKEEVSESTKRQYTAAYAYCTKLYEMQMKDIRVKHLESVINTCPKSSIKSKIRLLFSQVYKYALRHEIVQKNYAQLIKAGSYETQKERIPFSDEEIARLYEYVRKTSDKTAALILIGIFSGWRPSELLNLTIEDGIMKGGMKTEAGKNRIVPIHPDIEWLTTLYKPPKTYQTYKVTFYKVMADLGMSHRPHDTRHTFATLCDRFNVRPEVTKQLLGHSLTDITQLYTHRNLDTLKEEIAKIDVSCVCATHTDLRHFRAI